MQVHELSQKHLQELQLATERALQQWARDVFAPQAILQSMERVLLFLKQNGAASRQPRHVTSLAFVVGEQLVQLGGWRWASVSEDGSLNPAIVSPDGARACLVIDVMTLIIAGELSCSIAALAKACLEGLPHEGVVTL